ncbi:MAG TPA: aminoglycoside phosphotransferase family protein [Planctomycetaceae bacterium]|nr:aminoglycoside phosphotransferase family protein [Planctomycetaceae bacterium]
MSEPRWLTPETLPAYLVEQGHVSADEPIVVRPLAWGVSNLVLRVDRTGHPSFVVKQSRPQLRTKIEWLSRCERIYREADVLRALVPQLPPITVPRVLFEDRPNYALGLEAIRADHVVWKESLLQGVIDTSVADRLGQLLAMMHTSTFGQRDCLPDPDDWSLFDELRIDPFYRYVARVHPDLESVMTDLIDEMAAHRCCLVHADFSPKNVLIHPDGVSLVDFETGHWGDPAFDIGFFLSHLFLKTLLPRFDQNRAVALITQFWSQYRRTVHAAGSEFSAEDVATRVPRHLAGCLLARVDGKSPVDYLADATQRDFVRRHALAWLYDPPPTWEQLVPEWFLDLMTV